MKRLVIALAVLYSSLSAVAIDLTKATIVYPKADKPLVHHMAQVLADDIELVSGIRP